MIKEYLNRKVKTINKSNWMYAYLCVCVSFCLISMCVKQSISIISNFSKASCRSREGL